MDKITTISTKNNEGIKDLRKENEKLKNSINTMQADILDKNERARDLGKENEKLKSNINTMQANIVDKNSKIAQLERNKPIEREKKAKGGNERNEEG